MLAGGRGVGVEDMSEGLVMLLQGVVADREDEDEERASLSDALYACLSIEACSARCKRSWGVSGSGESSGVVNENGTTLLACAEEFEAAAALAEAKAFILKTKGVRGEGVWDMRMVVVEDEALFELPSGQKPDNT